MSGALLGGIVAAVAWVGLWVYLVLLNHRLQAALARGDEAAVLTAPKVTVTDVRNDEPDGDA